MAQNTELQERYSNLVLEKLRANSVFMNLFNRRYEGQPTAGAVKIPVRDTEVAVGAYSIANGKALTLPATTYQTLVTDQDIAVNELIDGYYAAAVPDNLVADRLDSAGYSMAKSVDDTLVTLLNTDGTALDDTVAIAANTIYATVVDAVAAAKKLGLRTDELWLAVTNEAYATIQKSPEFIHASALGDSVIQSGAVGRIAGVDIYETNNIPDNTKIEFILGNRVFCHFVNEWQVPVAVKDLADGAHIGASAVQGRMVHGEKVSRPTTVLIKKHA